MTEEEQLARAFDAVRKIQDLSGPLRDHLVVLLACPALEQEIIRPACEGVRAAMQALGVAIADSTSRRH